MSIADDVKSLGINDSMKDRIDFFLECFPKMTKDEADTIEEILGWDDSTKLAYSFAKRIFEEKE